MTSILKVDTIQDADGNNIINESGNTITVGASGDTISIPSGATIANSGTATGFGGTNTPAFFAYLGASQNCANNTEVEVVMNAETYDSASAFDTSTGRFTVPSGEGGKYYVTAVGRAAGWNANRIYTSIKINGAGANAIIGEQSAQDSTYVSATASGIMTLSAGDYISMFFYHNNGSTQGVYGTATSAGFNTYITGFKIIE